MRDQTKLRAFELADEVGVAIIIYQVTGEFPTSLQPKHLNSYLSELPLLPGSQCLPKTWPFFMT